jgi:hypothetical protein
MAPQSPIRTSTEAPIPMGPLHIMSPAVSERAAHAGALHERPGPSFIPPEASLGGVASGLGGRAPSHTSRPSGRAPLTRRAGLEAMTNATLVGARTPRGNPPG